MGCAVSFCGHVLVAAAVLTSLRRAGNYRRGESSGTILAVCQVPVQALRGRGRAGRRGENVHVPPPASVAAARVGDVVTAPRRSDAAWAPAGADVDVAGRSVGGGMVYVGTALPSVRGLEVEPALIVSTFPVRWDSPDWRGETLPPYFPSYARLTEPARAAYLGWLNAGRRHDVHIGYVFMFLYGIERRLFVDLECRFGDPEAVELAAEVRRLRDLYGDNPSFGGYSNRILDFVAAVSDTAAPGGEPDWGPSTVGEPMPSRVRVALGRYASRGEALPPVWALTYLRCHPERPRRSTVDVLPAHFDELFAARYVQRHGDGLTLNAASRPLSLAYTPASVGFPEPVRVDVAVPDVMADLDALGALAGVAEECCDSLDAYRRFVGRYPERSLSGEAASVLPSELLDTLTGDIVAELRDWASGALRGEPMGVASCAALVSLWTADGRGGDPFTPRGVAAVVTLLEHLRVGVEPCEYGHGWDPDKSPGLVLFELVAGVAADDHGGHRYLQAQTVADIAVQVVAPAGRPTDADRAWLVSALGVLFELSEPQHVRLRAFVAFAAAACDVDARGVRALGKRTVGNRDLAAEFLVVLATRRGLPASGVIANLAAAFRRLRVDEDSLYSSLHAATTGRGGGGDAEMASIGGTTLSGAKVRERVRETAQVSKLLGDIFDDADADRSEGGRGDAAEADTETRDGEDADGGEPAGDRGDGDAPLDGAPGGLWGLDEAHAAFAAAAARCDVWQYGDLAGLASKLGIAFVDAAIDTINEAAIEACGEPLLDGDGPFDVNEDAAAAIR